MYGVLFVVYRDDSGRIPVVLRRLQNEEKFRTYCAFRCVGLWRQEDVVTTFCLRVVGDNVFLLHVPPWLVTHNPDRSVRHPPPKRKKRKKKRGAYRCFCAFSLAPRGSIYFLNFVACLLRSGSPRGHSVIFFWAFRVWPCALGKAPGM